MKKQILLFGTLLYWAGLHSEEPVNLHLHIGAVQSFTQLSLKLTFADPNLLLWTDLTTNQSIPFANFRKLTFGTLSTGIDRLQQDGTCLYTYVEHDLLHVKGFANAEPQLLTIYTISGVAMFTVRQSLSEPIIISSLPKGIYLLYAGQQTVKFNRP